MDEGYVIQCGPRLQQRQTFVSSYVSTGTVFKTEFASGI